MNEEKQAMEWLNETRKGLGLQSLAMVSRNYSKIEIEFDAHTNDGGCRVNASLDELRLWVHERSPEAEAERAVEDAEIALNEAKQNAEKLKGTK